MYKNSRIYLGGYDFWSIIIDLYQGWGRLRYDQYNYFIFIYASEYLSTIIYPNLCNVDDQKAAVNAVPF